MKSDIAEFQADGETWQRRQDWVEKRVLGSARRGNTTKWGPDEPQYVIFCICYSASAGVLLFPS